MTNGTNKAGCLGTLVLFSGLVLGGLAGSIVTLATTYPRAYMNGYEAGKSGEQPKPYLTAHEIKANLGLESTIPQYPKSKTPNIPHHK
jgi:hypothetical protein